MSWQHIKAVWSQSKSKGAARLVMLCIADHANGENLAWPGTGLLVEETQVSERQVQRAIDGLVTAGEIAIMEEGNGRGRSTVYRFLLPLKGAMVSPNEHREKGVMVSKRVTFDTEKGDTMTPEVLREKNKILDTNVSIPTEVGTGQGTLFSLSEKPPEVKPNGKGRKKQTADPVQAGKTKELMTLYGNALGYKIAHYPKEAAAAKKITKDYTAEDAIGCYHWLKAKPFWRDKHLPLASVHTQLGEWIQLGRPSVNGNGILRADVLAYVNGQKPFTEITPLAQEFIRAEGESNVKSQPFGVTQKRLNDFAAMRH